MGRSNRSRSSQRLPLPTIETEDSKSFFLWGSHSTYTKEKPAKVTAQECRQVVRSQMSPDLHKMVLLSDNMWGTQFSNIQQYINNLPPTETVCVMKYGSFQVEIRGAAGQNHFPVTEDFVLPPKKHNLPLPKRFLIPIHVEYAGINAEKNGNHEFLVEIVRVGRKTWRYYQYDALLPPLSKEKMDACHAKANRQLDRPSLFKSHEGTKQKLLVPFQHAYYLDFKLTERETIPCTRKSLF